MSDHAVPLTADEAARLPAVVAGFQVWRGDAAHLFDAQGSPWLPDVPPGAEVAVVLVGEGDATGDGDD